MPDNLSDELKISTAFKGIEGVVDTDPDKSFIEEQFYHTDFITSSDVATDPIPYNDPALAVSSGVVMSGQMVLFQDPTVGGAYRGFTHDSGYVNFIQPQRFGNKYAPIFYHSSGAVHIVDGDFYENAVFDFKKGYVTVQRNALTDTWLAPLVVDGFWYTGRYLSGIVGTVISGSAGTSFDGLVLSNDLSLVFNANLDLVVH